MRVRLRPFAALCVSAAVVLAAAPAAKTSDSLGTVAILGMPSAIAYLEASPTITVSLSQPATNGLRVFVGLSGPAANGVRVEGGVLDFPPGADKATFFFLAGETLGDVTFSFTLSLDDAALFTAPAPITTRVVGRVGVSLPGPLAPNTTTGGLISLTHPPTSDVTVTLTPGGTAIGTTITPTPVTIAAGQTAKFFDINTGSTPGSLVVTATLGGPGAVDFRPNAPAFTTVAASIALSGVNFPAQGVVSQPVTVTLQAPPTIGLVLTPQFSGTASPTASMTPAALTFGPGETVKTFTFMTNSVGSLHVFWAKGGSDAASYVLNGADFGYFVRGRTTVQNVPAVLQRNVTSPPISVVLSAPTPEAFTVTPQVTSPDVSVSPAVINFAPGDTVKTFTLTPGPTATFTEVILVPNDIGIQLYEQAPTTKVQIAAPVLIQTNTTVNPAFQNLPVTIRLPRAALAPLTVDLTTGGSAGPVNLSASTVTFDTGETSKNVTIASFPRGGTLTISGTTSGPGALYFPEVTPHTMTVQALLRFNQTSNHNVSAGGTLNTSIEITVPLPEPVTVLLTPTGAPGAGSSFSPGSVTIPAGQLSAPVSFTAGTAAVGEVITSFTPSGPGAPFVFVSFARPIRVLGTISFSNKPTFMTPGETSAPITLTLSHANPTTFTMNVSANPSTVTPSPLVFNAGETTKTFTVTANTTASGILVQAFPQSGGFFTSANFSIQLGNTPPGTNVSVTPTKPPTVTTPVTVSFSEVTVGGRTTLLFVSGSAPPPSGYEHPGAPLRFGLTSTAIHTGPVQVCATYPDGIATDETSLRLFQINAPAADVTSSVDTAANVICGTAASLSPAKTFAILRPNTAPQVSAIDGPALVFAGDSAAFTATITDPNTSDTHTGTWLWGDGTTSAAVITTIDGIRTAHGTHTFATGGEFAVALVVSDGAQAARSADLVVKADGEPPVINSLTATPDFIWPPNKKMHDVVVTVDATDDSGTPVCVVTNVAADGLDAGDYSITGPLTLRLSAGPNRRVYTLTITCTDAAGRAATGTTTVDVDKEKKKDK